MTAMQWLDRAAEAFPGEVADTLLELKKAAELLKSPGDLDVSDVALIGIGYGFLRAFLKRFDKLNESTSKIAEGIAALRKPITDVAFNVQTMTEALPDIAKAINNYAEEKFHKVR